MVLSAIFRSSSFFRSCADHVVVLDHAVRIKADAGLAGDSFFRWVQTCIRVVLNQMKKGLSLDGRVEKLHRRRVDLPGRRFPCVCGQRTGVGDRCAVPS